MCLFVKGVDLFTCFFFLQITVPFLFVNDEYAGFVCNWMDMARLEGEEKKAKIDRSIESRYKFSPAPVFCLLRT